VVVAHQLYVDLSVLTGESLPIARDADLQSGAGIPTRERTNLLLAPPLLLADEPSTALDRDSGRAAVEMFHELADQQRAAIVMVTHDNKVLDIADRIVNLEEGRLVS